MNFFEGAKSSNGMDRVLKCSAIQIYQISMFYLELPKYKLLLNSFHSAQILINT